MKNIAICENHLYKKAYAKGKKYVGKALVVYVLPDLHASRLCRENPQKEKINRVGLTVTTKLGGSVTRNRVKRILREAYRLLDGKRGIRRGFLIVIVARSAAITSKTGDVLAELEKGMERLSMLER